MHVVKAVIVQLEKTHRNAAAEFLVQEVIAILV